MKVLFLNYLPTWLDTWGCKPTLMKLYNNREDHKTFKKDVQLTPKECNQVVRYIEYLEDTLRRCEVTGTRRWNKIKKLEQVIKDHV